MRCWEGMSWGSHSCAGRYEGLFGLSGEAGRYHQKNGSMVKLRAGGVLMSSILGMFTVIVLNDRWAWILHQNGLQLGWNR